jgi:hypothetical protein
MRILFHVVNRDDDLYRSWLKHERCEHFTFYIKFPISWKRHDVFIKKEFAAGESGRSARAATQSFAWHKAI